MHDGCANQTGRVGFIGSDPIQSRRMFDAQMQAIRQNQLILNQ